MDRIESFVPAELLERVRCEAGDRPSCTRFGGAALFADISQYTELAENLCQRGTEGAEQLAAILDEAFGRYVQCISESGGEVACFSGDSVLAYWASGDTELEAAIAQAGECAARLHAAVPSELTGIDVRPRLHIGIGAGEFWAARLGGLDGQWHLLLAGEAVREASQAAAGARSGKTRFSKHARKVKAKRSDDEAGSRDTRDAAARSVDAAADLVPRSVQEWVESGFAEWLPQVRNVVALFVRIGHIDERQDDALEQHQAAVVGLLRALRPFSASSGVLVFDDKGLIFKLCLGLRHDAHVDDPSRAIRAGLAIKGEFERQGLGFGAGVASGKGVCLPLGGPDRHDYVAVGRFMHVAARLMQESDGGLLCTSEVAQQARGEVETDTLEPLKLKGIKEPIQPVGIRLAPQRMDPEERLFGREFEKRKILNCINSLESGDGKVLWVQGDAGLGKTALVRYLAKAASLRGATCLWGGSGSVEVSVPYLAWRNILSHLVETPIATHAAQAGVSRPGDQLAGLRYPQLAPLINAVLPGYLPETDVVRRLSGEARAEATLRLLTDVIGLRGTSRLVIILEDCHWLDTASWRLVYRVAQQFPHILFVMTSRPRGEVRELQLLRRLKRFDELPVTPLSESAIRNIVEDVLAHSAGDALISDIADRAVGNPLYAREYTLLLQEQDRIDRRGSAGWELRATESDPLTALPTSVEGLISSRLDTLNPEEELTLRTASVLGDRFERPILAATYPETASDKTLDDALNGLIAHELLADRSGDGAASFAFPHALIRTATYQQMTSTQRQDLHGRAAETYESLYGEDLSPHFAILAHHWSQTDRLERTVHYSDLAATQALSSGAYLEAERLLQICLDRSRESGGAADRSNLVRWFRKLANARRGLGHLESRGAAARQALLLAGHRRPRNMTSLALQGLARGIRMWLRNLGADRRYDDASPMILEVARAYRHSAEVCYFNNDAIGMICDSVGAVERAQVAAPSDVLAGASAELGGVLSVAGLRGLGERIMHTAIERAESTDDQETLAYAHMIRCLYLVGTGDWDEAEYRADLCQEVCEPLDDRVNWTNAEAMRFWLNFHQDRREQALAAAYRLQERANETGNSQHRAWAKRCLALHDMREQRFAKACDHLEEALDCLGETAALNERVPTLGLLALARLRTGDAWGARARARHGLALVAEFGRPIGHATLEGLSAMAEVALDAWHSDPTSSEWRREVRRCRRLLKRYASAFRIGEARYRLREGDFYRLSGKSGRAEREYERGHAAATGIGMPWDESACRRQLAGRAA